MTAFVSSREYRRVFRDILRDSPHVRLAVAFWGEGADAELRVGRRQRRQIICNLRHGGTNPGVIPKLRGLVAVRQHDRLHAKVLLGRGIALIGSANVSANGLGHEGDETEGWEEAGVVTREATVIRELTRWFDRLWRASRNISRADLDRAKKAWDRRQADRSLATETRRRRGRRVEIPMDAAFRARNVNVVLCREFGNELDDAVKTLLRSRGLATTVQSSITSTDSLSAFRE